MTIVGWLRRRTWQSEDTGSPPVLHFLTRHDDNRDMNRDVTEDDADHPNGLARVRCATICVLSRLTAIRLWLLYEREFSL